MLNPYVPSVEKAIALVRDNALEHEHCWTDKDELYWLARLTQEIGELASAISDRHGHLPAYELVQIAGICVNWLYKLGVVDADDLQDEYQEALR